MFLEWQGLSLWPFYLYSSISLSIARTRSRFSYIFEYLSVGIQLDEDGTLDGSSDLTIKGRLLYLVERVTHLKKKQAEKPLDDDAKKPCKWYKMNCQY